MELGKRADYAVRAATELARRFDAGERRKARDLAEQMDIPRTFVAQVLADLVRAGLVVSEAGPSGGYLLARSPAEISLLEAVRAVEPEPAQSTCVLRGGPCRWQEVCAVHVPWSEAKQAMLERLQATTLAEIVRLDGLIAAADGHLSASDLRERAQAAGR